MHLVFRSCVVHLYFQEVAELKAIIDKLKQPATDISGMWKRTLADCVRKIEDDYKGQIDKMSEDMRRNYDEQVNLGIHVKLHPL